MTEKLFYNDPYLTQCEAEVKDIINKDGKILVVLDRTPFYPEGGGQPSDRGELNGIRVLHVYEEDNVIYHQVEKAVEDKIVLCKIDFHRRFDHMQQHSGEHLLSGAIFKLYNGNNKGFHLGEDYVTIDIDIDGMTEEMLRTAEDEVNSYIYKNREICTYVVSKEESKNFPMRKQINVDEDVRVVEAKDMDCCPCCGTHVLRTGEIGIIKIIKSERYKGMTRIYLNCGIRVLKDFQNKQNIISNLNRHLSSDENNLLERVENQSLEIEKLTKELKSLKKIIAESEAKNIIKAENSKVILRKYEDKSFEDIELIAAALSSKNFILILSSLKENKILFMNDSHSDISCGKLFKENIKVFNGKGGGNAKRAQGSFENKQDLINFSQFLNRSLTENN
ncbi:alanyl-tRNA editing protein [Clostridium magnum]|uniref:Alanine--tRNA ligase n=1 Tax=Clostridium magnum DSM 2767 TaxID=1121326 RepID=A0A162SDX2_9CLOT|nr:alanine--tRNA ligase-related protein [Clostridium magnum]KZL91113.1 alanine--tRNA ligase [Clostridium magnum DSM 2767]SHI18179.1 alanyl-tRNA synthetase [Clostridium magnum DSM 2767]